MNPSKFQKGVVNQFDYYCKRAIKTEKKDYMIHLQGIAKKEVSFSALGSKALNQFITSDLIPIDFHTFVLDGQPIFIKNNHLGKALKNLNGKQREVILLYYFLDMSDKEIGDILKLNRSTVFYHRKEALNTLREYMEDKYHEN